MCNTVKTKQGQDPAVCSFFQALSRRVVRLQVDRSFQTSKQDYTVHKNTRTQTKIIQIIGEEGGDREGEREEGGRERKAAHPDQLDEEREQTRIGHN